VAAGNYVLTAKVTGQPGGHDNLECREHHGQSTAYGYADQPGQQCSFTAPASVTINATAADSDGTVSKVEFFQGAVKLGEDTTSPYSYSWTNVAAGNYVLTSQSYRQPGSHDNLECRERHGQSTAYGYAEPAGQ